VSHPNLKDRARGEELLAAAQRGNERLFEIVVNSFYGEAGKIGRNPRLCLMSFGRGLGLSDQRIKNLQESERNRVATARRAAISPGAWSFRGKLDRWVLEDNSIVVR
jgi:hypothetical protein